MAHAGHAVLIKGPSGSGKSALALELLAYGASLIADDQVQLTQTDHAVIASCPPSIAGLIEARGVGILHATPAMPAPLSLVVDLSQTEADRLPPLRHVTIMGIEIPLLYAVKTPHFPAAVLQFLRAGRSLL